MPSVRERGGGVQMTINESYLLPEKIQVSGSGGHDGEDLQSRTSEAIVSGSGNPRLRVADALTAHVSASGGWGSIFGDPIIATAILDRLLPLREHEGQTATGLS